MREALAAEYEIIEELGRGGMALVYRARDRQLEREVAIKVLPFSLAFDAEFVERFQREARTAAQLEHPNIIPIYRVGRSGRVIYFVMKYLRGGSLVDRPAGAEEAHPARDPPAAARGRQRPRLRGPARHRPSRHQARQHHVRRVRPVRADRLRHRQGGVGPEAHRHRHVDRHAALHESRAGAGAGHRRPERHLQPGRRGLPVPQRHGALRRRGQLLDRLQAHHRADPDALARSPPTSAGSSRSSSAC